MPKRVDAPADMFMQFAEIKGTTGAVSNALEETKVQTGLTIRGGLLWLVHLVEINFEGDYTANFNGFEWALSTVSGQSTLPRQGDKGTVSRGRRRLEVITSGGSIYAEPIQMHYLPPIPLAAPTLSLYVLGETNHADGQNKNVDMRLGFTTAALDAKTTLEVAEVWGW